MESIKEINLDKILEAEGSSIWHNQKPLSKSAVSGYLGMNPIDILICKPSKTEKYLSQIQTIIEKLQLYLNQGKHAIGFLSYESGLAFHPQVHLETESVLPLAWFAIYDKLFKIAPDTQFLSENYGNYDFSNIELNISKEVFIKNIERIRQYIYNGDTYQVNYTCKLKFEFEGSISALYKNLYLAHPVEYASLISGKDFIILSESPEMFLKRKGLKISAKPMKGTVQRGLWSQDDLKKKLWLKHDPKNRAENIMIVDLLRNDLGKICKIGSIKCPKLFSVAQFHSVWQMTSSIEGVLNENTSLLDIFTAIFPSGSITGAPKLRTMQIISELETEPRNIYTGMIGVFSPYGDFVSNVAIRTLLFHKANLNNIPPIGMSNFQIGQSPNEVLQSKIQYNCELGIGSGITYSSDSEQEFQETLLKSKFIYSKPYEFMLIETMLETENDEPQNLSEHLTRLRNSAIYFGWKCPLKKIRDLIIKSKENVDIIFPRLVRVMLDRKGGIQIERRKLSNTLYNLTSGKIKIKLSPILNNPDNIFLYHKTTNRDIYDSEREKANESGFFEVLFLNKNGFITEGSFTNIFIKRNAKYFTPKISAGLLPGIWRKQFISETKAVQADISLQDLTAADKIYIGNSARGKMKVAEVYDKLGNLIFNKASM